MSDSRKKINIRIFIAAAGLCVFAVLLAVGTSNDMSISDAVFSDSSIFCKALGIIGPMPVFFTLIPLSGALVRRSLASGFGKGAKIGLTAFTLALTAGLCFLGARTFTSSDCLDAVIPSVKKNYAVMIPVMIAVFVPLGYLGFRLAKKNEDVKLVKRIILLMAAIGIAYASLEIIKSTMHRPRYRSVIKGYAGVDFVPWYEKFGYTKNLPEALGISKDEFASFPSGHSMMSMSSFIGLPALAWIVPAFRGREISLACIGFTYSAAVMLTRIISGAHYLTDISMSGVIMLTVAIIYMLILKTTLDKNEQGG